MTFSLPRIAAALPLTIALIALCLTILAQPHSTAASDTWNGLVIAPENRCSPYDRKHYPYPQSVELDIIASMQGRIYGPYTGRYFSNRRQTDIEHIVAVSEAHDSGLCSASSSLRRQFAADLLNLTLAAPRINRCNKGGKCAFDASQWQPPMNRCWYAARIVAVKRKYQLTVDLDEARALHNILTPCTSTDMQFTNP